MVYRTHLTAAMQIGPAGGGGFFGRLPGTTDAAAVGGIVNCAVNVFINRASDRQGGPLDSDLRP